VPCLAIAQFLVDVAVPIDANKFVAVNWFAAKELETVYLRVTTRVVFLDQEAVLKVQI
jgi:hypothetical protein